MAWTTNAGTATTSTWTNSGTSNTYNSATAHLQFKKVAKHKAVKRDPFVKKGFWDGIEWEEYKTYIPRKSITGKLIVGNMHRRIKIVRKIEGSVHRQYAKTKELFEEKLRGKA